jgi:tRNA pseudouridine55 synthase
MSRRKRASTVHGWVILDKPSGITSNQALSIVKRAFGTQKAGHAGTLDPLASGVLPIALGEATKTVPFAVDGDKAYRFTVKWGEQTDTDDSEGAVISTSSVRPNPAQIAAILPHFTGVITQIPPRYSAIKINGERAYDLAREGEEFEIKPRCVEVMELRLTAVSEQEATFECLCTKGTYVRAIARDMGIALGTLGHITALRRLQVASFGEIDSIPLALIQDFVHKADLEALWSQALKPTETALDDIPALAISEAEAARLRQGQAVMVRGADALVYEGPVSVRVKGELLAIADMEAGMIHPRRLFNFHQA